MDRSQVRTSKFLSLVLRHQPDVIGLQLDENGWADIETLIAAVQQSGRPIDRQQLMLLVEQNDKQRFAISEDGTRIRASQGHSIEVELGLEPTQPPEVLFHGTVAKFLTSISKSGLRPGGRQHVHLSVDRATASIVGSRRGDPVILVVDALRMCHEGFKFYLSENNVWLTDEVPPQFIGFPGQDRPRCDA